MSSIKGFMVIKTVQSDLSLQFFETCENLIKQLI